MPRAPHLSPSSLGSGVPAEDWATGSPLGLSMPKESWLRPATAFNACGFLQITRTTSSLGFYIKIAALSLWLPTIHFLPGVTFLSRWGSWPYKGSQQSLEAPRQLRSRSSIHQLPLFSAFYLAERSATAL